MRKILMILFALPLPLWAQKLDEGKFDIEKERVLRLSKAARQFERMPRIELPESNIPQQYHLPRFNYALPLLSVKMLPMRQPKKQSQEESTFRNFAKAGFGNYTSPYAELFLSSSQEATWQYHVHGLHFSSQTGPKDGKNSGSSLNKISGEIVKFLDNAKIYSKATYRRDGLHFYGYSPLISNLVQRENIRQHFSLAEIKAGYENINPYTNLHYKSEAGFYFFADRYKAQEIAFQWTGNMALKLNESASITTDFGLDLTNRRDQAGRQTRNLLVITPLYEQRQEKLTFKAGIRMAADGDSLTNQPKIRLYPALHASVNLIEDRLSAFASLEGNTIRQTFRSMAEENPFLAANIALAHTNQLWEVATGLQGNVGSAIGFRLKSSYGVYGNLHFFANAAADSSKFNILYDRSKVPVLQVSGEISYAANGFKITGRTAFFGYNTKDLARPWHRPLFTAGFNTSYLIDNKIRLSSELYHLAGIRAFSPRTGALIALQPVFDLNLQIDYFFNNRFSAFLTGYNLFSQRYQRFLNYEVRQLTVLGGVGIAF
ncbi:MAG: hypothetical protein RMJ87_00830 [Cytophagales bacterium]|nr:hypothetical protein [Bernardetiaceae bacterium]MDW8203544.1 hypothetical protein [Cytophagales bacterium]